MVYQTNLYSTQKQANSINVSVNEMKDFLGITILMGITQLPSLRDYWSESFRLDLIAKHMTRNRYVQIRHNLHFVDNSTISKETTKDRFIKIRPVLNSIFEKFSSFNDETIIYSVDDTMIPYKGRMAGNLHQYIFNKPVKWGFKFFQLAGADGIIYAFIPYQGTVTFDVLQNTRMELTENEKNLSTGGSVVIALCKTIDELQGCTIHCDNYFSSINLFLLLRKDLGAFAVGTFRSNRVDNCLLKLDKELKKEGRGSFDYRSYDNKIIMCKFFDNKCIHVGSTRYGIHPVSPISRWSKEQKRKVKVPYPNLVQKYNKNMEGVDKNNFLVALYRNSIKKP